MSVAVGTALTASDPLARRSVEVLKQGQAHSGAFVASPNFPVYRYAWLRDGAFCAAALDAVGEDDAALAFHRWVNTSVRVHGQMIKTAIDRVSRGEQPPLDTLPPARYTLDGGLERDDGDPWPNFQVDGYGMWLWSLARRFDRAPAEMRAQIELVANYLAACWRLKCFNCWEEFDDGEHTSTLGAVLSGLDASARLLQDHSYAAHADGVRAHLLTHFIVDGRFKRGVNDDRVDGSLLWLAVPFAAFDPCEPRIAATIDAVRSDLAPAGGVYRYLGDTYYGGGEWLLLASSLAWHDAVVGNAGGFDAAQDWVRTQATPDGALPEQVAANAQQASMVEPWLQRWGPIATPLLWSHAMYLLAEAAATTA